MRKCFGFVPYSDLTCAGMFYDSVCAKTVSVAVLFVKIDWTAGGRRWNLEGRCFVCVYWYGS